MRPKRAPEGAAGSAGNSTETTNSRDEGTGAVSAGNAATGAAEEQSGSKVLNLTQEQLDAIIERRLSKAKDPELEKKAKAYDELQAEKQTEAEKAEAKAKEADERARRAIESANLRLKAADIKLQAVAQGTRPEAVELVVEKLLTSDEIEIDDKGNVNGVEAAVKAILAKHDYLKKPDGDKLPASSGGSFTGTPAQTVADKIKELESKGDYKAARALKLSAYENGLTK
jgi:hypothetical protein